jgi:hypothetical protein
MRVFISWSGEKSKALAEALREWLPAVVQASKPFYSPDDMSKGTRWSEEVRTALHESKIGILCVSQENIGAPWLNFEAGALANTLSKAQVIPLLLDTDPIELTGPLAQFHAAKLEKADVLKVVRAINEQAISSALSETVLASVFEKWWPDLEDKVQRIRISPNKAVPPPRTDRAVLEELLETVRDIRFGRTAQSSGIHAILKVTNQFLDSLDLTPPTLIALQSQGMQHVGEILEWNEAQLLAFPMSRESVNEIKEVLASRGLFLPEPQRARRRPTTERLTG